MKGFWHLAAFAACVGAAVAYYDVPVYFLFVAGALFLFFAFRMGDFRKIGLIFFTVTVFFACWTWGFDQQNETALDPETTVAKGYVNSVPQLDGDRASFLFHLPEYNENIQVSVYMAAKEELAFFRGLKPGMLCTFSGELRVPQRERNFKSFDYRRYLYEQKVHWTYGVYTGQHEIHCAEKQRSLHLKLKQWRHSGIRMIENLFPEEIQGISAALLFGERAYLGADTKEAYEDLGLVHLLAISGLHVGLVSGFLFYVFIRTGISREHTCELLLLLLPMYAILAGAAPSVLRAVLMSVFVLLCIRFRFTPNPVDGLSLAFLLLLLYNPYFLNHVGFQLSFTITFSLICSASIFKKLERRWQQFAAVSILAQLASFPLIVYHFHTYSLLSLPLNFFYVPMLSFIILPAVWAVFILSLLSPSLVTGWLVGLEGLIRLCHGAFEWIHQSGGGIVIFGQPGGVWLFLMFTFLILALVCFEKRHNKALMIFISLFVVTACYQVVAPYLDGRTYITFIDVGQGDSILIEMPYRKEVYLIDGGGALSFPREEWQERKRTFDPGAQVVIPYLQARGIQRVDKVIVTHGDYDHYGGVFALIDRMRVGELLYPEVPIDEDGVIELMKLAQSQGVSIQLVSEGMSWSHRDDWFQVLNPGSLSKHENKNEQSIVFLADLYGTHWLFTGDLEESGENRLIHDYPELDVDILKAGHHGSRTSTTSAFVEHITPHTAVISAGDGNRFNHPHKEVLQNLASSGTMIYRTDKQGAIRFIYENNVWKVETKLVPEEKN